MEAKYFLFAGESNLFTSEQKIGMFDTLESSQQAYQLYYNKGKGE